MMKLSITCDPLIFTYLDIIGKKSIDEKFGIKLDIYQVISPHLQKEVLKYDTFKCHYTRTYYALKTIIDEKRDFVIIDAVEIISPGLILRKDLILDKNDEYIISGSEESIPIVEKYLEENGYKFSTKFLPMASFKEFLEKKIIHGVSLPKSFLLSASLIELGHRFVIKPEDIENRYKTFLTTFIICKRDIAERLKSCFVNIKEEFLNIWKNKEEVINYFLIDRDLTKETSSYLYDNMKFYTKDIDDKFLNAVENYLKILNERNMIKTRVEDIDLDKIFLI